MLTDLLNEIVADCEEDAIRTVVGLDKDTDEQEWVLLFARGAGARAIVRSLEHAKAEQERAIAETLRRMEREMGA